jgi:hypothetical protein
VEIVNTTSTPRIAANNVLLAARQNRIVIANILRGDYLSALSRVTNYADADGFYRVLAYAQRWVGAGDWSSIDSALSYLERSNAFVDPGEAALNGVHLEIPSWSALPG